jgi:glycosyltransferase involved in cell wall biosynthesis
VISKHLPVRSGPARARNAGISLSTGNILAFTDSDCRVDPHWIENLCQWLMHHPGYAGVGGRVLPLDNDLYSQYNTLFRILEPPGENPRRLVGANCMFWKKPVLDVGLFDEYFSHPGGEETALCMKLWVRGYRFGLMQDAIVYHDYRKSLKAFIRTFLNYGAGEKIICENRLTDYLQYWEYPERAGNVIAMKNTIRFRFTFPCHLVSFLFAQIPFLRTMPFSTVRKFQLFGLFAIHHFCYHIGRGTFFGTLEKSVHQFLLDNPDCLLILNSDENPNPHLLEITNETLPEFVKPGQKIQVAITVKNNSNIYWISTEFFLSLFSAETNTPIFQSDKTQKLLISPNSESVFEFLLIIPEKEKVYTAHLFLSSLSKIPISKKIGKKIIVTSDSRCLDAEVIDTKFPEEMVSGEQASVRVLIKNTGIADWTEKNQIRLGSENDASGTGAMFGDLRITLPQDARIPPGCKACFIFRITAPQYPGRYRLRYRMVCENYSWFGMVADQWIEVKSR